MLHVDKSYAETLSTAREGACFGAGDAIISKVVRKEGAGASLADPWGKNVPSNTHCCY